MTDPIKIDSFTGMKNIEDAGDLFTGQGTVTPRIILNSDVTRSGNLVKRDGYTSVVDLTAGHSMWSGATCILVMDGLILKRLDGKTLTTIQTVTGPQSAMFYSEVGDKVYISSKYYNGIFDPETNTVSSWGITLPSGPVLATGAGAMAEGLYHVCLTTESDNEISGNGPISQITLSSTGGISISNRGADDVVWCTDPNGDIFFRVGKSDGIINIPSVEPLPSLFCYQPPYMENLTHAFGRMWGSKGNILYYSEPFHLDWWKTGTSFFEFATDITLVANMATGIFVGCKDRTYCLLGSKPEEMKQLDVGAGAVSGSLGYCNNVIELGDTISPPEKKHVSIPGWMTSDGSFVLGNPAGRVFNLSQEKIKFVPGDKAASLFREKNGQFQFLTSFQKGGEQSGLGMSDEATVEVIRNGKVI